MGKTLQDIPRLLWAEKPCSLIGALESALAYAVEMFDTPEIHTDLGTYYHGRRAYDLE